MITEVEVATALLLVKGSSVVNLWAWALDNLNIGVLAIFARHVSMPGCSLGCWMGC